MADFKNKLQSNKILLLVIPSLEYNDKILQVMKELSGKSIAYVTLNKTCESLRELFQKNSIPTDKVVFVDAVSKTFKKTPDQSEGVFYCSSPGSLTELSLIITKFLKHGFNYLIFDSVNNLAPYQKKEIISKFISSLTNKIRSSKTNAIFYVSGTENDSKDIIQQVGVYADSVVDMRKNAED